MAVKWRSALLGLALSGIMMSGCTDESNKDYSFYLGTYTRGDSEGIYKVGLDESGVFKEITLQAKIYNPSYLAFSPDSTYVLAVEENTPPQSLLSSFAFDEEGLSRKSTSSTEGAHPCHIAVNEEGYVVTSNYSGGSIALHRLLANGKLSSPLDTLVFQGKGPSSRQEKAHAHSSHFWPDSKQVLTLDLGSDRLWLSEISNTKRLRLKDSIKVAAGSGPRHAAFHPNKPYFYVLNELTSRITQYKVEGGSLDYVASIPTLPADYEGPTNTTAEVKISPKGDFLYVSNRGHNSIAVFALEENGATRHLAWTPTEGDTPRNFSLTPDGAFLVVGNQDSSSLVCFKRDETTGLLEKTDSMDAPYPSYILFE